MIKQTYQVNLYQMQPITNHNTNNHNTSHTECVVTSVLPTSQIMVTSPDHDFVASDRHRVYSTPGSPTQTAPKPQKLFNPTPHDPASLLSKWSHRVWVTTGCTTVLVCLATAIHRSHTWLEPTLAGFIGYLVADLESGVYHWLVDNYGGPKTPIFGKQIDEFQNHHMYPSTITKREFANNLYKVGFAVTWVMVPVMVMCRDWPMVMSFLGVSTGCVMFCQQFHAWAHGTKNKLPWVVLVLQDAGLLVSRVQHSAHHRPPFNNNYCIVSGIWNRFLDEYKVFEGLENVVFSKLGVRPRSWMEEEAAEVKDFPAT